MNIVAVAVAVAWNLQTRCESVGTTECHIVDREIYKRMTRMRVRTDVRMLQNVR